MRRRRTETTVPGSGFDDERRSATAANAPTVLLVGGAGYLGSVLARELLERDHAVRVLDDLTYGDHGIADLRSNERFELLVGDMRSAETVLAATEGVDAVVHIGGLVGDQLCAHNPRRAVECNYYATKRIAEVCKQRGIDRFLFASSCSVYGKRARSERSFAEAAEPSPISLYARNNLQSERTLAAMCDADFSPTILRMATLYGLSPRMRFDLVVNAMTAKAYDEGVVPVFGGEQYRPVVHVRDAARAYVDCLAAPLRDVGGETFNVGTDEQNYRIAEIGELIAEQFPDAEIDRKPDRTDERSYRVEFSKIRDVLGYRADETVEGAAVEIRDALETGRIGDYTDDRYRNYRAIEAKREGD